MAENKFEIIEDKLKNIEDDKKQSFLSLTSLQDVDKPKKIRAPSRTIILEDGTTKYDYTPLDPQYFVKYYHSTGNIKEAVIVNCELCHRQTTAGHKHRHQKTNICKKLYNLRLSNEDKSLEDEADAK